MKTQTKIDDLVKLIAATTATATAKRDSAALNVAIATRMRERAIAALDISLDSKEEESNAQEIFAKLPLPRRDLAKATKAKAEVMGRAATKYGDNYSGATDYTAKWTQFPVPSAKTHTEKGEKYSRGCTYRKTDASHVASLSPEWAVLLAERSEIAELSARDGLSLIGWHQDGRVCWVRQKNKAIASEIGYIAASGSTCYHSTDSQSAADKGLARKLAALRAEWKAQSEARANAAQVAKGERRARLVARLCNVSATIGDALAMGLCRPGIEAFQSQHHIGDAAPLRALLNTGNSSAIRLALSVARKFSRPVAA